MPQMQHADPHPAGAGSDGSLQAGIGQNVGDLRAARKRGAAKRSCDQPETGAAQAALEVTCSGWAIGPLLNLS